MPHTLESMERTETPRHRASEATLGARRRFAFFCLAALWGYVLGIGVLAAAMSRNDLRVPLDGPVLAWISGGSLVGIAGGLVAASAYREARRRHR